MRHPAITKTRLALTAAALLGVGASGLAYLTPQTAEACGGTFCDNQQGTPVDQTGENILFVIDGAHVEAHIQIQYDPETDAEQFAWVVPLQALPTFSVGSDPLFTNVLNATVPTFQLNTTFEFCGGDSNGGFTSTGATGAPSDGDTAGAGSTGGEEPGPDIVFMETVGAFDVVVLQDDNVASLMQWLGDNGYTQDPAAEPIFQQYLDENFLFAAFKLTHGAGVDQIHPVVLEFDTGEACIPLRLTKIAATEDMEVRSFFLGNARTVPKNYRHVLINPIKIDWLNLSNIAANYKDVITQAVDAFKADGHAFVTEYAGPSSVVNEFGIHDPAWDSAPFDSIAVIDVVNTLQSQGLMQCFEGEFCQYNHPLAAGLLAEFLPVPDGLNDFDFYSCLTCYEGLIDLNAWDGAAFAQAYSSRIIEPGAHALELLQTWPYLTRMYTTISPGEMTEDPLFHQNPDLGDVTSSPTAQRTILCNGDAVVTLPDGREVYIPDNATWPTFDNEMPYAEDIETTLMQGAPMTLVDNTEVINQKLEEWNKLHGWPQDPDAGTTAGPDGPTSGDDSAGTGSGTDSAGATAGDGESGCGCRSTDERGSGLALTLLLLSAGLWTRRRRA
ncbi:MAG: DUF2330 domain-containing protein [Myxococcales bacterium]|nr:DUF2330 domain-containing protein [Myxococcales bacterium]